MIVIVVGELTTTDSTPAEVPGTRELVPPSNETDVKLAMNPVPVRVTTVGPDVETVMLATDELAETPLMAVTTGRSAECREVG